VRFENSFAGLKIDDGVSIKNGNDVKIGGTLTCSDASTSVVAPVKKSRV
jgi:hypothetical protein